MSRDWIVDNFRIGEVLDAGAQASVHRARQINMGDREVAVKIYESRLDDPGDRVRFDREIQALKQLSNHTNVVTVYSAGVLSDRRPFFAMEFCPGGC